MRVSDPLIPYTAKEAHMFGEGRASMLRDVIKWLQTPHLHISSSLDYALMFASALERHGEKLGRPSETGVREDPPPGWEHYAATHPIGTPEPLLCRRVGTDDLPVTYAEARRISQRYPGPSGETEAQEGDG